jgi:hypothetical protein
MVGPSSTPQLPGYRDLAPLGRGGYSEVYRAYQDQFDRWVAVKVLTFALQDDRSQRRFLRECRVAGRLSAHPNIVTVYDAGLSPDGRPYISMELFDHGSIADRLRRGGPFDIADVLRIAVGLAGALETAHRAGVVHRDVKPANVLLAAYGQPALTDFGLSILAERQEVSIGVDALTPYHAPPEVLERTSVTATSDVYSLASTTYAMLAGRAPHQRGDDNDSMASLLLRILQVDVPPVPRPDVPDSLDTTLRRALARDAHTRTRTALDFAMGVQQVQAEMGLDVTQPIVMDAPQGADALPPPRALDPSPTAITQPGSPSPGAPWEPTVSYGTAVPGDATVDRPTFAARFPDPGPPPGAPGAAGASGAPPEAGPGSGYWPAAGSPGAGDPYAAGAGRAAGDGTDGPYPGGGAPGAGGAPGDPDPYAGGAQGPGSAPGGPTHPAAAAAHGPGASPGHPYVGAAHGLGGAPEAPYASSTPGPAAHPGGTPGADHPYSGGPGPGAGDPYPGNAAQFGAAPGAGDPYAGGAYGPGPAAPGANGLGAAPPPGTPWAPSGGRPYGDDPSPGRSAPPGTPGPPPTTSVFAPPGGLHGLDGIDGEETVHRSVLRQMPTQDPEPERRSRKWLYVAVGTILVLGAGGGALVLMGGDEEDDPPSTTTTTVDLEVPANLTANESPAGVQLTWEGDPAGEYYTLILSEAEPPRFLPASGSEMLIPAEGLQPDVGYCFAVASLESLDQANAEQSANAFSTPACIRGASEDTVQTGGEAGGQPVG